VPPEHFNIFKVNMLKNNLILRRSLVFSGTFPASALNFNAPVPQRQAQFSEPGLYGTIQNRVVDFLRLVARRTHEHERIMFMLFRTWNIGVQGIHPVRQAILQQKLQGSVNTRRSYSFSCVTRNVNNIVGFQRAGGGNENFQNNPAQVRQPYTLPGAQRFGNLQGACGAVGIHKQIALIKML
jgi:hypothetical protein